MWAGSWNSWVYIEIIKYFFNKIIINSIHDVLLTETPDVHLNKTKIIRKIIDCEKY